TSLGNNWNPHTWEPYGDDALLGYVSSPFVTMQILNSEDGVYQWVYEMATEINDVTATHQEDLTKYAVKLQDGKTAEDTTEGYVYEIKLNPDACWEDGTPINADTYIYSMQQLLDPAMKNYRANLYYAGESAVAGGNAYYYSDQEGYYQPVGNYYESVEAALEDGKEPMIDVWNLWGAQGYTDADGNECPQYVSVTDEVVYGEAVDDTFSCA
ncbi:MAG: hypothetical protein HUJ76_13225, partial [Parasporobacterium sp.]|nr:hypothetical protein [Parasporobacterium sp.]